MSVPDGEREVAERLAEVLLGTGVELDPLPGLNHSVFRLRRGRTDRVLKMARSGVAPRIANEVAAISLAGAHRVPVPTIERVDADGTLAGRAFVLLGWGGAHNVAEATASAPEADTAALFRDMGRVLATVHAVRDADARIAGVVLERATADDYRSRLVAVRAGAITAGLLAGDELGAFDDVAATLPDLGGDSLCHGDFHAVQCLTRGTRVSAVVDWESACLGDPMVDLSLSQAYLDLYAAPSRVATFLAGYAATRPLEASFQQRYRAVRATQILAVLQRWHARGERAGVARARRVLADVLGG